MTETIEQEALAAAPATPKLPDSDLVHRETPEVPEKLELRACPCGQVPTGLYIELLTTTDMGAKMGAAAGSCCGTWRVEFLNRYAKGEDSLKLAVQAWNDAPRAG